MLKTRFILAVLPNLCALLLLTNHLVCSSSVLAMSLQEDDSWSDSRASASTFSPARLMKQARKELQAAQLHTYRIYEMFRKALLAKVMPVLEESTEYQEWLNSPSTKRQKRISDMYDPYMGQNGTYRRNQAVDAIEEQLIRENTEVCSLREEFWNALEHQEQLKKEYGKTR